MAAPPPTNHPPHLPPAPGWPIHPAMVTVLEALPGFRVARSIATVHGSVVRAIGPSATALTNTVGAHDGTALRARSEAVMVLLNQAAAMGANAVVGLRFDAVAWPGGVAEICAYGTAVWADAAV